MVQKWTQRIMISNGDIIRFWPTTNNLHQPHPQKHHDQAPGRKYMNLSQLCENILMNIDNFSLITTCFLHRRILQLGLEQNLL